MNSQSSKVSQKWLYIQNTINRENFKNNTISKFNIELILIYEESAVLEIDFQIITNNVSLRHKHTCTYIYNVHNHMNSKLKRDIKSLLCYNCC